MVLVMVLMLMKNGKREDDATIHIIVETNFQVRSPVRLLVLGGSLLQFIRMKRAIFVPFAFSLFKNKTRESATLRYNRHPPVSNSFFLLQSVHLFLLNVTHRCEGGGVHAIKAALCDAQPVPGLADAAPKRDHWSDHEGEHA